MPKHPDHPTKEDLKTLDALAQHAASEYEQGKIISLREYAKREGIDLGDDIKPAPSDIKPG